MLQMTTTQRKTGKTKIPKQKKIDKISNASKKQKQQEKIEKKKKHFWNLFSATIRIQNHKTKLSKK